MRDQDQEVTVITKNLPNRNPVQKIYTADWTISPVPDPNGFGDPRAVTRWVFTDPVDPALVTLFTTW